MQLRHLFRNDPSNPATYGLSSLDFEVLMQRESDALCCAFGSVPEPFVANQGVAKALQFFFESWQRRQPDPVPAVWICGPAGIGKTSVLSILGHGLFDYQWPQPYQQLNAAFKQIADRPPQLLMLSAQASIKRFGIEPLAIALLRAFNSEQGYTVASLELAALERWLEERDALEAFVAAFHGRTGMQWNDARESAQVLREDLLKAMSGALHESRERAEKDLDAALARANDPAKYLLQLLMKRAESEAGRRILVLLDDFDQLFNGDEKLMRDGLQLISHFACDSHGRISVVISSRKPLHHVLSDWGDWTPAGIHTVNLSASDALELLYTRWLKPDMLANVSLAMLEPEATHPFSAAVLQWLDRILAAQPSIHVLRLLAAILHQNAERSAVELIGPSRFMGILERLLPSSTRELMSETIVGLPYAQAELLSALVLAPLGGQATLSDPELAQLAQARIAEPVLPTHALQELERLGWLRRLESGVALSLPESQARHSIGEQVPLTLRERMRVLAELLFDKVLQGKQQVQYRNRRDYAYNRLCDSHAHGSASHELSLMLLTSLAPEYEEFDEFHAVLRSAEGGGQALLKLAPIDNLAERIADYVRTRFDVRPAAEAEAALLVDLQHAVENSEVFVAGRRLTMTAIEAGAIVESALTSLIESVHSHVGALSLQQSEALSMIRVVLGGRELPPGENAQALATLEHFLEMHIGQIFSLNDLVQRYRSRPYGWPDLEIVLLVARLANAQRLNVRIDRHTARPAESAEAFTNAALWTRVFLVRTPPGVTETMLNAAALGKQLFGHTFSLEQGNRLAQALRADLDGWRNELQAMAQPNELAGAHDARDALNELKRLALLREGSEFLEEFVQQGEALTDIAADLVELRTHRAVAGPAFDRLRKTLVEIQPNVATLRRDAKTAAAIDRLQSLQGLARVEQSQEIEQLCDWLGERHFALIAEMRDQSLSKVEAAIAEVSAQIQQLDVTEATSEKLLRNLQSIRDRVDLEASYTALVGIGEEAIEERNAALDALNRQVTAERPAVGEQSLLLTVVRPGRLAQGMVIEQEADLDVYFEKVRESLVPLLKSGMRVRLE